MTTSNDNDDDDAVVGAVRVRAFSFSPAVAVQTRERPFARQAAFGLHTWPSAHKLAACLHRLACVDRPGLFRGRSVIELGCGTALPGLLLAQPALGAERVLLTDRADAAHVLDNARETVALNFPASSAGGSSSCCTVAVAPLSWGKFPLDFPGAFDVIVAADCCYNDDDDGGNEAFLATVTYLLREGAAARSLPHRPAPSPAVAPPPPPPPPAVDGEAGFFFFPVCYLAYPERGNGPSLRAALRRWGLEARQVDDDCDEGAEEGKEGYRVYVLEVRCARRDRRRAGT